MNTEEKDIETCNCNDNCDCTRENKTCDCNEVKEDKKKKKDKHQTSRELEEAKNTIMELQTKLMYAQADSINYRKRKDEETANMLKYANQDLILDLINVVDNLDRAALSKAESEESKKIQAGISMVNNQFKDILNKYGVVEIEALGYPFDSDYMEAMMVESDSTKPNDMVLEVLMKGYKLKDRVIKHAVVKVNQISENEKGNE